jgi:hypothetical protein
VRWCKGSLAILENCHNRFQHKHLARLCERFVSGMIEHLQHEVLVGFDELEK